MTGRRTIGEYSEQYENPAMKYFPFMYSSGSYLSGGESSGDEQHEHEHEQKRRSRRRREEKRRHVHFGEREEREGRRSKRGGERADSFTLEVSCEENPSELFVLMNKRLWSLGIAHLKRRATEARTWICSRYGSGEVKWKNLPLHLACLCGPEPVPLPFVEALINAYPKAAQCRNHEGNLPIHLACDNMGLGRHGLEAEGAIITLVKAFPESLHATDAKGRRPLEILQHNGMRCDARAPGRGVSIMKYMKTQMSRHPTQLHHLQIMPNGTDASSLTSRRTSQHEPHTESHTEPHIKPFLPKANSRVSPRRNHHLNHHLNDTRNDQDSMLDQFHFEKDISMHLTPSESVTFSEDEMSRSYVQQQHVPPTHSLRCKEYNEAPPLSSSNKPQPNLSSVPTNSDKRATSLQNHCLPRSITPNLNISTSNSHEHRSMYLAPANTHQQHPSQTNLTTTTTTPTVATPHQCIPTMTPLQSSSSSKTTIHHTATDPFQYLEAEFSSMRNAHNSMSEQLQTKINHEKQLLQRIHNLESDYAQLKQQNSTLSTTHSSLTLQLEEQSRILENARNENKVLRTKEKAVSTELALRLEKDETKCTKVEDLTKELDEQRTKNTLLQSKLETQTKLIVEMEQTQKEMTLCHNDIEQTSTKLKNDLQTQINQNQMLQSQISDLEKELQQLKLKESTFMEQLLSKLQTIDALKKSHTETQHLLTKEKDNVSQLQAQINVTKQDTMHMETKVKQSMESIQEKDKMIEQLQQSKEQMEARYEALREVAMKAISTIGILQHKMNHKINYSKDSSKKSNGGGRVVTFALEEEEEEDDDEQQPSLPPPLLHYKTKKISHHHHDKDSLTNLIRQIDQSIIPLLDDHDENDDDDDDHDDLNSTKKKKKKRKKHSYELLQPLIGDAQNLIRENISRTQTLLHQFNQTCKIVNPRQQQHAVNDNLTFESKLQLLEEFMTSNVHIMESLDITSCTLQKCQSNISSLFPNAQNENTHLTATTENDHYGTISPQSSSSSTTTNSHHSDHSPNIITIEHEMPDAEYVTSNLDEVEVFVAASTSARVHSSNMIFIARKHMDKLENFVRCASKLQLKKKKMNPDLLLLPNDSSHNDDNDDGKNDHHQTKHVQLREQLHLANEITSIFQKALSNLLKDMRQFKSMDEIVTKSNQELASIERRFVSRLQPVLAKRRNHP